MAIEPSLFDTPAPEEDKGSLAGAVGKQVAIGGLRGLVGPGIEALKYATNQDDSGYLERLGTINRGIATAIEGTIPEARRKDAAAVVFPDADKGEQSIFENPASSIFQKVGQQALPMAALMTAPGVLAQAGVGAVQGGGGYATEIKTAIENATDEELRQMHPSFAQSETMGFSAIEARRLLTRELLSPGAVAAATAGGAAGGAIMGSAARPGVSMTRSVVEGAGKGAGGMGVQAGVTDVGKQLGEVNAGERANVDVVEALKATLNPIAEGTVIGGVFGVHGGLKGRPPGRRSVSDPDVPTVTQDKPVVSQDSPIVTQDRPPDAQRDSVIEAKAGSEPTQEQTAALTPEGKVLTMDEKIAAEDARLKAAEGATTAEAPVAPPVAEAPPVVPPVAQAAPHTPSEIAAAGAPDLSTLREAIHAVASKNTKLDDLYGNVARLMGQAGELTPSQGDFMKVLQAMKKGGELTNKGKGWRTTRAKIAPETVIETPVPERPSVPMAEAVAGIREATGPDIGDARPVGVSRETPVASEPVISPTAEPSILKPAPKPAPKPKTDTVAGQESKGAASKPRSMREELNSLQGKTDPESVARREVIEARFKAAADRAELLGKPKPETPVAEPLPATAEPTVLPTEVKPAEPKAPAFDKKKASAVKKIMDESRETDAAYQARVDAFKAEQTAAREASRTGGKPFVFKEVPKRSEGITREEAEAQYNAREAEGKRAARVEDKAANDKAAEEVVRDTYLDADGKPLVHEIEATEKAARNLEAGAISKLLARASAIVTKAREAKVAIGRTRGAGEEGEVTNKTPWASYVRDAELFVKNVKKVMGKRLASDYTAADKKSDLHRIVDDHIYQEEMLRQGKYEEAAERRNANNREVTEQEKVATGVSEEGLEALKNEHEGETNATPKRAVRGNEAPRDEGYTLKELVAQGRIVPAPKDGANTAGIYEGHYETPAFWNTVNAAPAREAGHLMGSTQMTFPKDRIGRRLASIVDRLVTHAGNVKVVIISDKAFERSATLHRTGGIAYYPSDASFFRGSNGLIVIRESAATNHILVHEVVHAATSRLIATDPAFRGRIRELMDEVKGKFPERKDYAFKNEHEFIAEALSNPDFQMFLQDVKLSKPAQTFWGKIANPWLKLVHTIGQRLGITDRSGMNALDATLRAGSEAMDRQSEQQMFSAGNLQAHLEGRASPNEMTLGDAREKTERYFQEHKPSMSEWKTRTQGFLNKIMSFTQMGNVAEPANRPESTHWFGPNTPARNLGEAMSKMFTDKETIRQGDRQLISDMHAASRKYGGGEKGSLWDRFQNFMMDETSSGAFADRDLAQQGHLGKNDPKGWYGKERYVELNSRWNDLVKEQPQLEALRQRAHDFFRERQNQMSLELIKNHLRLMDDADVGSDALATRIHEGTTTDADMAVLGDGAALASIKRAGALAKINGPYVPNIRRGDFVVQARHEIATPAGARRLTADEVPDAKGKVFEFKTEAEAKAFVKGLTSRPEDVSRVYVDPETGSRYVKDEDGKRRRLTSKEPSAEQRYRVTTNDQHTEFYEREKHARARVEELRATPGLTDVKDVDLRRLNAADAGADFMPEQIRRMMTDVQKRTSFKRLDKEAQRAYLQQLKEAGIAAMSTTRAQTRSLPRRNVAGASEDITRGLQDYSSSTSAYLSRLKHQPKVDAYLKQMSDYVDTTPYADKGGNTQVLRRQLLQEFQRRVYTNGEYEPTTFLGKATSRLLQISYLDKLASPAFHIINSMEPWTTSLPVIAGRHGFLSTVKALHDAYRMIGAGDIAMSGLKDTARAFRRDEGLTDYTTSIIERVRKVDPEAAKVIEHLHDTSLMSRNAGMELGRMVGPEAGLIGRGLDRGDLMARQMGTAIESINRAVTALAAYKLERAKGATHEAGLKYANEATHDTMGDYSAWNAAPIFNHPLGRLMLQFRKYAQKTYYLLGKNAVASFKGDPEAMKAFAGLMGTHMMVAGALGLPLEPIKLGMLAAGMLGLTDKKYGDLEQGVREGAANVLGVSAGEIFTRGWPRFLGADLANRVGLDNLLTSNMDPKSMKTDDLYAYFARTFAGAPASFLVDAVQGFQAAGKGDLLEASRLLTPLKMYADGVQAYQMATEGKKTGAGRQVMPPISVGQAAVKVLGFTPGNVAESQEQGFATRGDISARTTKRNGLISQWVNASPGDKAARYKDVMDYNKSVPSEAQIKPAQLSAALQRRKKDESSSDYSRGIKYTKGTRDLRRDDVYNTGA